MRIPRLAVHALGISGIEAGLVAAASQCIFVGAVAVQVVPVLTITYKSGVTRRGKSRRPGVNLKSRYARLIEKCVEGIVSPGAGPVHGCRPGTEDRSRWCDQ